MEAWSGEKTNLKLLHTFGCLVQYLKVGHDKDNGGKLTPKTAYAIFIGMPKDQSGYLIWDPTRSEILVRTDVKFYDNVPGYPRMKNSNQPMQPRDSDYFTLFPMGGGAPSVSPAIPPLARTPTTPSLLPAPLIPIDAIQLSSDTESGVNGHMEDAEEEVQGRQREESIADRVAARRRAQFASFGDVL